MAGAALDYAAKGWRVFPLLPGEKTPCFKEWQHKATSDAEQVRRWWERWRGANIGLATGPLVAIDLDVKPEVDGRETWEAIKAEAGIDDGGAWVNLTPRGGHHLIFEANGATVRSSAGQLGEGVDVRGVGGYIVLPPSTFKGKVYTWEISNHPDDGDTIPLPAPLLALLATVEKRKAAAEPVGAVIPKGKRNDTLTSLAGTMRRRGLGADAIEAALQVENANRCQPPLGESDVEKIAASIGKKEPAKEPTGAPRYTGMGSNWAEMAKVIGRVAWTWETWLPKGMLTLIVGDSGEGKSSLLLRIMACVLEGYCWPDGEPFRGDLGSVLWCESEAAQALNLERAREWELPLAKIQTALSDFMLEVELDNDADLYAIDREARLPEVKMIGVDSLRGAVGGDENAGEISRVVQWLARLARDTNKPVLLVHHLRKRGLFDLGDGITLERVRGSSAIVQHARVVWAVDCPDPMSPNRKRLSCIKNNLARFPEPVGFEIETRGLIFTDAPEPPRRETVREQAADLLVSILSDGELPQIEIERDIKGAGLSWSTARRAKKALGIVSIRRADGWYWGLPARQTELGGV